MVSGSLDGQPYRSELRVPTGLIARITTGTGTRVAVVYNLSVGGAYFETHRPMLPGGRIRVALPFSSGSPQDSETTQYSHIALPSKPAYHRWRERGIAPS